MSLDREKEGGSLIDKPEPTAPVIPETPPPPYSSFISPQQFPVPQVTPPYSAVEYNRIEMPLPAVYALTSYDLMASGTGLRGDRDVIGWRNSPRRKSKDTSFGTLCAALFIVMLIFIFSWIANLA